jgi:hypothetical protein
MTDDQEARAAGKVYGRADAKGLANHDDYFVERVESETAYERFQEAWWAILQRQLGLSETAKSAFVNGWRHGAIHYAIEKRIGLKRTSPRQCKRCALPFGDGAGMIRVEVYPGQGLEGGLTMVPCDKCRKKQAK